jgi:hypothetical protein
MSPSPRKLLEVAEELPVELELKEESVPVDEKVADTGLPTHDSRSTTIQDAVVPQSVVIEDDDPSEGSSSSSDASDSSDSDSDTPSRSRKEKKKLRKKAANKKSRKSRKMKKLSKLLAQWMDDSDEESDDEYEDDDCDRSRRNATKPELAKKTVPELGKDEQFFSFYRNFKLQIESWVVKENSSLFKEYFEVAIQKNPQAKSEYWSIRARHPEWKMGRISAWMVKRLDKVNPEEIKKNFDRLCQGAHECVTAFLERYQDSAEAYRMFYALSESRN